MNNFFYKNIFFKLLRIFCNLPVNLGRAELAVKEREREERIKRIKEQQEEERKRKLEELKIHVSGHFIEKI